jgi:hypothetical protein
MYNVYICTKVPILKGVWSLFGVPPVGIGRTGGAPPRKVALLFKGVLVSPVQPVRTGRTGGRLLQILDFCSQVAPVRPVSTGRTDGRLLQIVDFCSPATPVGLVGVGAADPSTGRSYLPPSLLISFTSLLSFFYFPSPPTSHLSSPTHIHPPNPNLPRKGTKDSWWGTSPPRPPPSGSQVSSIEKRGKPLFSRYESYPRPISFYNVLEVKPLGQDATFGCTHKDLRGF